MKPLLIFLSALFFLNFQRRPDFNAVIRTSPVGLTAINDSSKLRFTNNSSLKHLPSVIRDLKMALSQSTLETEGVLSENGLDIALYDAFCKSFDTSAKITFRPGDRIYYMELNHFNKHASDRALAATLIHELMHCVLLDLDKRGRLRDEKALSIIEGFNQKIKSPFSYTGDNFFGLMNVGDAGQHELMYQLFYDDMVLLLERFAQIHRPAFWKQEDAQYLMWSGLQATSAYGKLNSEERQFIEYAILREKGFQTSYLDY